MATMKITYNGNVIDERDMSGNPAILYNGKIIGDVILDNARTLETENTVAVDNIIIGSAVLNCNGKALKGDIEIVLENTFDPVLENNTWEQISQAAKSGQAASLWSVGDTKAITCNGNAMTVQIIGFDHDDVTDSATYGRSKAGITFQTVECYPTTYKVANIGAITWKNSYARTDRMKYFLTGIGDIQNYVVPVNKLAASVGGGNTAIETVSDKLFLLSTIEVFGKASGRAEGSQYAYYSAGNTKIKKAKGSAVMWWHRTPVYSSDTPSFWNLTNISGTGFGNRGVTASTSFYYAFAFCV